MNLSQVTLLYVKKRAYSLINRYNFLFLHFQEEIYQLHVFYYEDFFFYTEYEKEIAET